MSCVILSAYWKQEVEIYVADYVTKSNFRQRREEETVNDYKGDVMHKQIMEKKGCKKQETEYTQNSVDAFGH